MFWFPLKDLRLDIRLRHLKNKFLYICDQIRDVIESDSLPIINYCYYNASHYIILIHYHIAIFWVGYRVFNPFKGSTIVLQISTIVHRSPIMDSGYSFNFTNWRTWPHVLWILKYVQKEKEQPLNICDVDNNTKLSIKHSINFYIDLKDVLLHLLQSV